MEFNKTDQIIEDATFEYDEIECHLTTQDPPLTPVPRVVEGDTQDFEVQLPPTKELSFNPELGEYADIARHGIVEVAGDDKYGDKVITFSACRLPPMNEGGYQRVLNYLMFTLDKYVENDYVIVYFHHGLSRQNTPSIRFLYRAYRQLDRNYKKNIKALFIVHPSTLINLIVSAFQKIVSSKFSQKINRISNIAQMNSLLRIDQLKIPHQVKLHDIKLSQTVQTVPLEPSPTAQFGVSLEFIYEQHKCSVPPVVEQCIDYITKFGLDHVGIFRMSANKMLLDDVRQNINQGIKVNFGDIGDIVLVSVLFKRFFGELTPPLFPDSFYPLIVKFQEETDKLSSARDIVSQLSKNSRDLLFILLDLLDKVQRRSAVNLMTSGNLSIVFGCNLCQPLEGLSSLFYINHFVVFLIDSYHDLKD